MYRGQRQTWGTDILGGRTLGGADIKGGRTKRDSGPKYLGGTQVFGNIIIFIGETDKQTLKLFIID